MIKPIQPHPALKASRNQTTHPSVTSMDFESMLRKEVAVPRTLHVSAHAQHRLQQRGIEITPAQWSRIEKAVTQSEQKGAKESLIITDRAAFIVSIPNHTVITAISGDQLDNTVFTNIDSAVLLPSEAPRSLTAEKRPDPKVGGLDVADR